MSTEQEPTAGPETTETAEQYNAHVNAFETREKVKKVQAMIEGGKLKGKDLSSAKEVLAGYESGNVTAGTIEAFAHLTDRAAELPFIQSVLQAMYGIDVKLALLNPRTRQIVDTAKKEFGNAELITLLDKKHDGVINAAGRGLSDMANSTPFTKLAFVPFKLARTAYRGARTAVGYIPGLEQSPENWTLEDLQYAIFSGIIPASDEVVKHAISKLPSESGIRAAVGKGVSLMALAQPEVAVIGAGMKLADTAETAKVRALLAVRAERMSEQEVTDLSVAYEEAEMHAAGVLTDNEEAQQQAA